MALGGLRINRGGRPCNPDLDDSERRDDRKTPILQTTEVIPLPPQTLGREGIARWNQLATILIGKGILSTDYYPALEHLCRMYDQLGAINTAIGGQLMVKVGKFQTKPNPLLKNRQDTMIMIRSGMADFGLTPASARAANVPTSLNKSASARSGTGSRKEVDLDQGFT